ncbi:MAG: T9SS type A sorting domain-containing protein [Ignavibacteria bacterium]|nr:T9SS type A sorting domain-containing protein [Ignavibacteria bacterium]
MKNKTFFIPALLILSLMISGYAVPQWINLNSPATRVTGITNINTNLIIAAGMQGVFLSSDNGSTWIQRNNGIDSIFIYRITSEGNNVFISSSGTNPKIYRSSNLGLNWTEVMNGLPSLYAIVLYASNNYVYAGFSGGLYYTTNSGVNWISANWTEKTPTSFVKFSGTLFAGTSGHGVFKSTDNGINWTACNNGLTTLNIKALEVLGTDLFAGTYYGGAIYKSTDNGNNWTEANSGIQHLQISSLAAYGSSNIFAAANDYSGCIYHSTNSGQNWITKNQGFGNTVLRFECMFFANDYVFAGTYSNNIWRRSAIEIIGIKNISTEIPDKYQLWQNYPNPFNPITKIKFDVTSPYPLQRGINVVLKVFDLLGREVATIVNEKLQPGTYEVTFDGSRLASGMYFYQLRTNDFVETKKLIILK